MRHLSTTTLVLASLFISMAAFSQSHLSIGVIAPLSGPHASAGEQFVAGAVNAINEINAKGGIKGRQVDLHIRDGECNPMQYASQSQSLTLKTKVKMVLELACGGSTLATSNASELWDVPHLVLGQSGAAVKSSPIRYGNITGADAVAMGAMSKKLYSKSVPFSEASLQGQLAVEVAEQAMKSNGSDSSAAIVSSLQEKSFFTTGGTLKFPPAKASPYPGGNTFLMELWADKKDCPKCPKSGACPQALEKLLAEKKTCN